MRSILFPAAAALALLASPAAYAGCGTGAALGAVAGHMVGSGHAVAGAAAGCAVGHEHSKHAAQKASAQQTGGTQGQSSGTTNTQQQ